MLPKLLPLPDGWQEYRDEKGQSYYHHASQGLTQWEHPQAHARPRPYEVSDKAPDRGQMLRSPC